MEKRKMKRKYADPRKIEDVLESKYANLRIDTKEFKGNIALVEILKANKEWIIDEGKKEERCILGKGVKWLEIYPEKANYAIMSIYNDKKEILEWYIDIANEIGLEDGVPYEDDLYLDVIILPSGRIFLLDEDELEEAYENNIITKYQYDLARNTANDIMKNGKSRIQELKDFSNKYLDILEKEI